MTQCLEARRKTLEAELERTPLELRKRLAAEERQALATAQAAWASYRDGGCAFEARLYGEDTLSEVTLASCRAEFAQDRVVLVSELNEGISH